MTNIDETIENMHKQAQMSEQRAKEIEEKISMELPPDQRELLEDAADIGRQQAQWGFEAAETIEQLQDTVEELKQDDIEIIEKYAEQSQKVNGAFAVFAMMVMKFEKTHKDDFSEEMKEDLNKVLNSATDLLDLVPEDQIPEQFKGFEHPALE